MGMTINTNIASLNGRRNLGKAQARLETAMQRLSSGLRVNSAKDDAAGLAISDRMTAQIRGMNQAARNLNDGISMLQTAEGALQEVTGLVQRGRELAVQAGNEATLSHDDKNSLQAEIEQIKQEIDRIAENTTFNGIKVLDHGEGGSIGGDPERLAVLENLKSSWLSNSEDRIQEFYGLTTDDVDISFAFDDDDSIGAMAWVGPPATVDDDGRFTSLTLTVNLAYYDPSSSDSAYQYDRVIAHEMTHAIMGANMDLYNDVPSWFVEGTAEFIAGGDERLYGSLVDEGAGTDLATAVNNVTDTIPTGTGPITEPDEYSASYAAVRYLHDQIVDAGGDGMKDVMTYMADNPGKTLNDAFTYLDTEYSLGYVNSAAFEADFVGANGDSYVAALWNDGLLTNTDVGGVGGADADGGEVLTNTSVIADIELYSNNPLEGFDENWFGDADLQSTAIASTSFMYQAGANAGEVIRVSLASASTRVLNLHDVDITQNAGLAITRFDTALEYIDERRGEMGAAMNRMESSIANLQNVSENLAAARSRIVDADIAQETSVMTKQNILQQAGVSILAQANQVPQLALSLLGQ